MQTLRAPKREHEIRDLLHRDHTLNGGILFGIEGHVVELQARAMDVYRKATSWPAATRISGMARGAISESLDHIDPQVESKRRALEDHFTETEENHLLCLRAQVEAPRQQQHDRFATTGLPAGAAIPGRHVPDDCRSSPAGLEHYKQTIDRNTLSTRSMDRLAEVARTIADLRGTDEVQPLDVDRAAGFVVGGVLRDGF